MILEWSPKDPTEVDDFVLDWSRFLDSDVITSSTWALAVAAGLTAASDAYTDTATVLRLTGGTANAVATLTNTVTTTRGRTLQQSVQLRVMEL